jgi:tetratricopeptide (TPR) repeat protein
MNESVQKWLTELTAAPSAAIQKLVLGYAGVSAWSRSSLRESFVEIFQTHAEPLDSAVAGWLQERLMKLPPQKTPTLVWASHLQDLFSALAGLPLPQVARLLRGRLRDLRSWLRPLRMDESLDPEAAYLAALAWAETNQHLEGMWQGLALRGDREPSYYTDIGLLGLRKTRDQQGQLPAKPPFLLLATLIDLADLPGLSEKDWLLTARALLGGYHYSLETWVREFEPVLQARHVAQNGPKWLTKVLPIVDSDDVPQRRPLPERIPTANLAEAKRIIADVAEHGPNKSHHDINSLLDRYRIYTRSTKDTYPLVRMFNQLAEAARTHDPDWAIARADEALAWDRNNVRNWTVLARCLWARGVRAQKSGDASAAKGDCREAMDTLWTARFRFWWEPYVRTELGRLHHDAGDLETSEAIYREAMGEFPNNPACRCGLAEVLAAMGRVGEAEQLYRDTCRLFPDNAYCRNGLAKILFYRSARTGDGREREEARELVKESAALGDRYARSGLNSFDQRWQLLTSNVEALAVGDKELDERVSIAMPVLAEMRPEQRLGRALLLQWQARCAESTEERERLFAEAKTLLDLPDELTGECRTAFVEARGFLLLARDRATEARAYFEQQLAVFTRPPLGLRLGFAEARARLGETLSDTEEAELASFGSEGSILPLVLKVVRLLESTAPGHALRDLLLDLYPRVRELAGMPASELGEEDEPAEPAAPTPQPETPDTMMAHLLLASVFQPAAINTPDDLQVAESILRVRTSLKTHRDDIFSVAEKLALAA